MFLRSRSDHDPYGFEKDDSFWGIGKDGTGKNELGKALMRLRDRVRDDGAV